MTTDSNLLEIARQADAIVGDQDDGVDTFEAQMHRALTRPHPAGADPVEVVTDDIGAAVFMCGHDLNRSPDADGNLHYTIIPRLKAGRELHPGASATH